MIGCLLEDLDNFLVCEVQRLETRIKKVQGLAEQTRESSVSTKAALEEIVRGVEANREDISNLGLKMETKHVNEEDLTKKPQEELSVLKLDLETGRRRLEGLEAEIQKAAPVTDESMRRQEFALKSLTSREKDRLKVIETLQRELRQTALTNLVLTMHPRNRRLFQVGKRVNRSSH
jgi:hypothetical protein